MTLWKKSAQYWLKASKQKLAVAYAEQAAYETDCVVVAEEDRAWLDGLIGDALKTDDEKQATNC